MKKRRVSPPPKPSALRQAIHRWWLDLRAVDAEIENLYTFIVSYIAERFESWSNSLERLVGFRGPRRFFAGLISEGLTLSVLGLVVMVELSRPASELIAKGGRSFDEAQITFVDRNGLYLGKRGLNQNKSVEVSEIPENLIQAILATEDRRFFDHVGIDLRGISRAMINNIRRRNAPIQGGSTITQQVAKNLFLSNERTLSRKINEAFISLWLEMSYTKDEIFKLYTDYAYLGNGAFGVEAASQAYFGKSVRDINLPEAAMLAGLFQAPGKNAPHINYTAAEARARAVLSNMVEAGFLTESQAYWAEKNPAKVIPTSTLSSNGYFLDYAYKEALDYVQGLPDQAFVVHTSLDLLAQSYASQTIQTMLDTHSEDKAVDQAAAIIMEPGGAVVAMVGGRDYTSNQFNRATEALRQPGSSFKPFVYMTAIEQGYSPDSIVYDRPITIGGWSPKNHNDTYQGAIKLRNALRRSINTVAVRLQQAIGRSHVIEMALRLGIESPILNSPSLALGTSEITPIDLSEAYAIFANGGHHVKAYAVVEIRSTRGQLIYDVRHNRPNQKIVETDVIADMNQMLYQVIENGTGRRAQIKGRQVLGKTGTTNDFRDAWFAGFTGNMVGVVWFGNDNFRPMNEVFGGTLPAETWQEIMSFIHLSLPKSPVLGLGVSLDSGGDNLLEADQNTHQAITRDDEIRLSSETTSVLISIWQALELKQHEMLSAISNDTKSLETKQINTQSRSVQSIDRPLNEKAFSAPPNSQTKHSQLTMKSARP